MNKKNKDTNRVDFKFTERSNAILIFDSIRTIFDYLRTCCRGVEEQKPGNILEDRIHDFLALFRGVVASQHNNIRVEGVEFGLKIRMAETQYSLIS